jgi:hypothetical protein
MTRRTCRCPTRENCARSSKRCAAAGDDRRDATVLGYATGTAHPLESSYRELVAAIADGRLAATTTVEVIQEFAHVRAEPRVEPRLTVAGTLLPPQRAKAS